MGMLEPSVHSSTDRPTSSLTNASWSSKNGDLPDHCKGALAGPSTFGAAGSNRPELRFPYGDVEDRNCVVDLRTVDDQRRGQAYRGEPARQHHETVTEAVPQNAIAERRVRL